MEDLISVIIPIYKVEKYIDNCINSVVMQTYKNLEIILVDDGSPDQCPKICDKWKLKDNRIVVIHKTNGGLSSARNEGIKICKGRYIVFVDSDDYIDYTMIEKLHNDIIKNEADMSICNFYTVKNNNNYEKKYAEKNFSVSGKEKYDYLFNEYYLVTVVAWNKMYKKEIFDDLRYQIGKINEDEFIICDILNKCNKISYILEPLYYYIKREGSIMQQFNIKRFDIIEALDNKIQFFLKRKELDKVVKTQIIKFNKLLHLLTIIHCKKQVNIENDFIDTQTNNLKQIARELKDQKCVNFKQKIKIIITLINPNFLFFIVSIKYKLKRVKK